MLPATRSYPLPAELRPNHCDGALHDILVLLEISPGLGLEAQHEDGLRVRCPHEPPAARETDPHAVDVDDLVPQVTEAVAHHLGDPELHAVGADHPDLGGGV